MKGRKSIKVSNIALLLAFVAFGILIYRVSYLSLSKEVDGIDLQTFAKNRTTKKTTIPAKRGTIYDANGNILSQDVSSYTLIAYLDSKRTIDEKNPQHVVDKENTALVLSAILDMDKDQILKYLNKEGVYQTEFGTKGRGLNEIVKDTIKAANLPGIDFIETTKRYYPYGDFASYLIGYAKEYEDKGVVGELGIEKSLNDMLKGEDGYTEYQKDRNGYKIAGTKEVVQEAVDGDSVYLTIDNNVQFFVEKALSRMEEWDADRMTIVVADAKTAKILAYATNPSFDPNTRNITNYLDDVSGVAFEPGSTMKIFTYMAAIENNMYDGKATYKSGSYTTKDKTVIRDWNRTGWGWISYDQGFVYSSNTAVVNIMDKYMDAETLRNFQLKLGFGTKTGVDVPMEASGKIAYKYETEIFNAAFGQGITTTPIQYIKALTTIANNGDLLKPYVVDKVVNAAGEIVYENKREVLDHVVSSDTIAYIKNLMWHTINDNDGAAHSYYIKDFDIIGKTGTAQIANTNGRGYLTGASDVNRSVVLMFPKDDPQIIIYAVAKRAESVSKLASIAKEIVTNISKYYNIYEENNEKIESSQITVNNYLNKNVSDIKKELTDNGLEVIVLGNGKKIIKQYPETNSNLIKGDKIFLLTNGDNFTMPDLTNYGKIEVKTVSSMLNIGLEITGNGYVINQSIKKDEEIKEDMILEVELKLPY
jgi:penicillin-binding protein 2B